MDIQDDDTDSGMGLIDFYLFMQILFLFFWSIAYLVFNQYVQQHLPVDQRQRPTNIKFYKKIPLLRQE